MKKNFMTFLNEALEGETFSPTGISDENQSKDEEKQELGAKPSEEAADEADAEKEQEKNETEDEPENEKDAEKKEEAESLAAKSKARKKKIKAIRDHFIEEFNQENEGKTRLKISAYEPYSDFIKSIKVTYEIDPEEIYLDKDKYEDGAAWLELNDIFFKDINSVAANNGIKRIEWKRDDNSRFGNLILSDRLEESL